MQVGFIMARSKQEGLSLENYEALHAPKLLPMCIISAQMSHLLMWIVFLK